MCLSWSQLQDKNGSSSEEEEADEDIEAALKKEVAQLKASGVKQERRFQALVSGANNVIFIKTKNLGTSVFLFIWMDDIGVYFISIYFCHHLKKYIFTIFFLA